MVWFLCATRDPFSFSPCLGIISSVLRARSRQETKPLVLMASEPVQFRQRSEVQSGTNLRPREPRRW